MAQKLILALAACLAIASGAVVRERREAGAGGAPATTGADGLQELQKNAAEFQKTFTEGLNAVANSKNSQELTHALRQGSDTVLQQLSAFSASLQAALGDANGKAKEVLEQARATVERSVAELRHKHPEVEQRADQLKHSIAEAVKNVAQESQKVAKEVAASVEETNKKLAPQLQKAFQEFASQADKVQKNLHEIATRQ